MTRWRIALSCLIFMVLLGRYKVYGQAAPGCTAPYYRGNYGPVLDGSVVLYSLAQGPDASIYLGSSNNLDYAITKLDSVGNMIRSTSYAPSGVNVWNMPGKTIVDADGNLFSVIDNNYILRTDTAGNVLWGKKLTFGNIPFFNLLDVAMLANGDKVFLYAAYAGGNEDEFVVVTSPDVSLVRWIKYLPGWTYSNSYGCILADGNKVVVGVDITGSVYYPNGTALITLNGATGAVLQQLWFSQCVTFNRISRYATGYIFGGYTIWPSVSIPSDLYIRTDTSLNILAVNNFPNSPIGWPNGFPFIFQAQPDGSVYGFYSNNNPMTLFLISPADAMQWTSGVAGFIQSPVAMTLDPDGIFIGTCWTGTDVITGGTVSSMQVYKASYSGYFPPCTSPTSSNIQMAPYLLPPTSQIVPIHDTVGVNIAGYTIQSTAGTTLTGQTCTGTPSCNSIRINGNANVCTGTGGFVATASGCPISLTWSVSGGPGTATMRQHGNNAVSIDFSQDGAYMVKALVNNNCTIFGDSLLVHVSKAPTLSLGNDTTICSGSSLLLHAGSNFSSYTWQNGSTDSTLPVTVQGQYSVTAVDYCGNTQTSGISVSFYPPLASSLPATATKCPGDTLSFPITSAFDSAYFVAPAVNARVWHDSVQFFNTQMASYVLQERDIHACTVNGTIAIRVYPTGDLHIGDDTTICPGDSLLLDAGTGFTSYLWNTGSQNQTIEAATKGNYWVRAATADGCILRDSIALTTFTVPVVHLDADCQYGKLTLAPAGAFNAYLWSDGSTGATLVAPLPGWYSLRVTDKNGCVANDSILLTGKECLIGCYVPSAFTPNNDGRNDLFRPVINGNVIRFRFTVFNRWGQMVFSSTRLLQGWDGTVDGAPQPAGEYVWYCEYQLQGEKAQMQKGTVMLIR